MSPRPWLIVFAKAPRLGAAKRRLAREAGTLAAWRFYRRNSLDLLRRLGGDPRWGTVLAVTPDRDAAARFWPPELPRLAQGPGDLGHRMDRAMRRLPPGPVVLVGSDIPGIRRRHVAEAFRALGRADAVFGPAADGGYWLVGLRRCPRMPQLFEGVRWSSEHALADTLANLPRGMRHALLEELSDVDTAADLARIRASRRSRAPAAAG